ncbi:hypothetical protein N9R79_12580 [Vibrio sp.]|nr:hypothetical protein [Vibrio sp.]
MTFQELFSAKEAVEVRINQYWTFWSVVIFGVCGWIFSQGEEGLNYFDKGIIVGGLIIFFLANLSVLLSATKLSLLLHDEIHLKSSQENLSDDFQVRLKNTEIKCRLRWTIIMHLIIDIAVIAIVLVHSDR